MKTLEPKPLAENTPKEALTQIEPVTEIRNEPKMESVTHKENIAEPLRRKLTPSTAEYGIKIRKLRGKDGLFRVWSLENQAYSYLVDLNAKTCTCPDFTQQGAKCRHIEIVENIGEILRQKKRDHYREYRQKHREHLKEY